MPVHGGAVTSAPPGAAIRRAVIEHAIERVVRAVPEVSWRWVIVDRPEMVDPILDASQVARSGQQVVAQFDSLPAQSPGLSWPFRGTLLHHFLKEAGVHTIELERSAAVEAALRSVIGAPSEARLLAVALVAEDESVKPPGAAEPTSILAVNGWDGFTFTSRAPSVPNLPPTERFKTFGICGSCLKYGACRLGAVTRLDADGVVRGSVTIPEDYAGSPGLAHGGFVATIFDDVLSRVAAHNVVAAMTGTYQVMFRGPVPTQARLSIDATLDSVSGRKRLVSARLRDDEDEVLAEGSGTWIEVIAVPKTKGEG